MYVPVKTRHAAFFFPKGRILRMRLLQQASGYLFLHVQQKQHWNRGFGYRTRLTHTERLRRQTQALSSIAAAPGPPTARRPCLRRNGRRVRARRARTNRRGMASCGAAFTASPSSGPRSPGPGQRRGGRSSGSRRTAATARGRQGRRHVPAAFDPAHFRSRRSRRCHGSAPLKGPRGRGARRGVMAAPCAGTAVAAEAESKTRVLIRELAEKRQWFIRPTALHGGENRSAG